MWKGVMEKRERLNDADPFRGWMSLPYFFNAFEMGKWLLPLARSTAASPLIRECESLFLGQNSRRLPVSHPWRVNSKVMVCCQRFSGFLCRYYRDAIALIPVCIYSNIAVVVYTQSLETSRIVSYFEPRNWGEKGELNWALTQIHLVEGELHDLQRVYVLL